MVSGIGGMAALSGGIGGIVAALWRHGGMVSGIGGMAGGLGGIVGGIQCLQRHYLAAWRHG